jgi:hypothetical protein
MTLPPKAFNPSDITYIIKTLKKKENTWPWPHHSWNSLPPSKKCHPIPYLYIQRCFTNNLFPNYVEILHYHYDS